MSSRKRTDTIGKRARQAADRVRPAAAQVRPLASSTTEAAGRRVRSARAWAAPRVERTGQLLQHSVAPKVSAALSSAARRLEPGKPGRRRWRAPASLATVTATASAAAAYARNRRKPDPQAPPETADEGAAAKAGDEQSR